MLTGDSWSPVMWGAMVDEQLGCDPTLTPHHNCGSWLAIPYFISFIVIGNLTFLNLVVAIILENFSAAKGLRDEQARRRARRDVELVTDAHIEEFARLWAWFDTDGDNCIRRDRLAYVVARLKYPLGLARKPDGEGVLADAEENDDDENAAAEAAIKAKDTGMDQRLWLPYVKPSVLEEARALVEQLPLTELQGEESGEEAKKPPPSDKAGATTPAALPSDVTQVRFNIVLDALLDRAFRTELKIDADAVVRTLATSTVGCLTYTSAPASVARRLCRVSVS